MSPEREQQLCADVAEIKQALVGTIDGKQPGLLHLHDRLSRDFYCPENPKRSHPERLSKLEEARQRQVGALAAGSFIGAVLGWLLELLFGKR